MTQQGIFRRIAAVICGYFGACGAAVSVVCLGYILVEPNGREAVQSVLILGFPIIFFAVLPGFVVVLLLARLLKLRNGIFFTTAGSLCGLASIMALSFFLTSDAPGSLVAYCTVAGGVGGLAYWWISRIVTGKEKKAGLHDAVTIFE